MGGGCRGGGWGVCAEGICQETGLDMKMGTVDVPRVLVLRLGWYRGFWGVGMEERGMLLSGTEWS